MADIRITEPDVIARLPRSSVPSGRSWFCQVQGLRGGERRKRPEICAAVDGDSVSIYEIQRGKSLGSCAVPPDSIFACAPFSIRLQNDTGIAERRTYYVLQRRNKLAIHLFDCDAIDRNQSTQTGSALSLSETGSPVVQVELLPTSDTIVVLHENGSYELFTLNLDRSIRNGKLEAGSEKIKYIAFSCLSGTEASTSILKARPDVGTLSQSSDGFLCGISTTESSAENQTSVIHYSVWSFVSSTLNGNQTSLQFSHMLQVPPNFSLRDHGAAQFTSKSSRLLLNSSLRTIKFDLTMLLPGLISDTAIGPHEQYSNIEVSEKLTLTSSPGSVQLYNSAFGSIQAQCEIGKNTIKRKRGSQATGPVVLLYYFTRLHRAIATRRNYLVAIDLQFPSSTDAARAFKQSSMLISNIGKGLPQTSRTKRKKVNDSLMGTSVSYETVLEGWSKVMKRIDECISGQDIASAETAFLDHTHALDEESSSVPVYIPDHIVSSLLSRLFDIRSHSPIDLELKFPWIQILIWLSENGYITLQHLQRAFPPLLQEDASAISIGMLIAQALIRQDSSFTSLLSYLISGSRVEMEDLCQVTDLLMQMALIQAQPSNDVTPSEALSNGADAVTMTKDQSSNRAANTSAILCVCVTKLSTSDTLKLPATLRKTFKPQNLTALVQFLRQQLFHGGYTRSALHQPRSNSVHSAPAADNPTSTDDVAMLGLSLDAIATVLSSCIDAFGPVGLLGIENDDRFIHQLIPDLASEVSRALDALNDADYVQGILRETLRYCESSQKSHHLITSKDDSANLTQKIGTIRTLYSESTFDRTGAAASVLPISLRAEGLIDTIKSRRGGGRATERSKREMGMLQDRLRGPYSLERLVL